MEGCRTPPLYRLGATNGALGTTTDPGGISMLTIRPISSAEWNSLALPHGWYRYPVGAAGTSCLTRVWGIEEVRGVVADEELEQFYRSHRFITIFSDRTGPRGDFATIDVDDPLAWSMTQCSVAEASALAELTAMGHHTYDLPPWAVINKNLTAPPAPAAPAGWYPEPWLPIEHPLRWWTGHVWTNWIISANGEVLSVASHRCTPQCGLRADLSTPRGDDERPRIGNIDTSGRIWLDVPFEEKDAAKAAGARWDGEARSWWVHSPSEATQRWLPLPEILPGENRSSGGGELFVDLIPQSCWFTNVRSCVTDGDWSRLRAMVTRRAGFRCEVCGATRDVGLKRWLEVHERWAYDDATATQRLERLICLCTDCHVATHFGRAELTGRRAAALYHLMAVRRCDLAAAEAHIHEAVRVWQLRSARAWELDLSMLTAAGITPEPPPGAGDRAAIAGQTLRRKP